MVGRRLVLPRVVPTRVAPRQTPHLKVIKTMDLVPVTLAQVGAGGTLAQLIPLLLIIVVFYFLIIRPQQARARQQRQLVASLATGDRIVTIGGLHGTVQSVDDETVRLEVAPNTVVTFSKAAVARRLIDLDEDEVDLDRTSGE
jgi:preprotein translocase subunit YajC